MIFSAPDNGHGEVLARIEKGLAAKLGLVSPVTLLSGDYLLVWEFNPARALYERLGGRNVGIADVENPGGGIGRYVRYAWDRPQQLTD